MENGWSMCINPSIWYVCEEASGLFRGYTFNVWFHFSSVSTDVSPRRKWSDLSSAVAPFSFNIPLHSLHRHLETQFPHLSKLSLSPFHCLNALGGKQNPLTMILLLILWEFHTCIQCILNISKSCFTAWFLPDAPFPASCPLCSVCYPHKFMSMSHPLEHGQPKRVHTFRGNWLSLFQEPPRVNSSWLGVKSKMF